jgi:hypothetical protein
MLAGLLAPAAAAAEGLTFKWPVPGKVSVTERVVKRGVPATIRYDVTLAMAPDRKRIAVRLTGLDFVEVAGLDARDPAVRKKLAPALRAATAVPTVLINSDGTFDDIADLDRTLKEVGKMLPAEQRAVFVKAMKAPQMLAMMKERSADFWGVWVGMWAGGELQPGKSVEVNQETALPDGATLERPIRFTHHGPAGPPAHVRLSFESSVEGDANNQALRGFVASLIQQWAPASGEKIGPETFQSFQMAIGGDVVTDPATLRPVSARSQRRMTVKVNGEERSQVETHEYTFTWPKPAVAPRP